MSTARKILIIDDDDDLRESLSDQFALHDEFDSLCAENAAQGLELSKSEHIDLILLDVGLPDTTSYVGINYACAERRPDESGFA